MTNDELRAGLAEIVHEIVGVNADDVQPEKLFVDDLSVDSLSMIELIVALEQKFGVEVPDAAVKELRTVADAIDYLAKPKTDA